jgi:hypothetical protein
VVAVVVVVVMVVVVVAAAVRSAVEGKHNLWLRTQFVTR